MIDNIRILYEILGQPHESEEWLGNETLFSLITKNIIALRPDTAAQSISIVGQPGSGKTFFLNRIYQWLNDQNNFNTILLDGRSMFSNRDIEASIEQSAYNRRLILLIDDIQYYFQRTLREEHYQLRGSLNRANGPMIICTSNVVLPYFTSYQEAFFEAFDIQYLFPPLPNFELTLFNQKEESRAKELLNYLPKTWRSLYLTKEIIKSNSNPEMDLHLLCDIKTPEYRSWFSNLSTITQRVILSASRLEMPFNLKSLSQISGLPNTSLPPYLNKMVKEGIFIRTSTVKNSKYQFSDPLLPIWLNSLIKSGEIPNK